MDADDYTIHGGGRAKKLRKRRTQSPTHGRGGHPYTLNDAIERGKLNKPQRGGKREIIIEEDDNE